MGVGNNGLTCAEVKEQDMVAYLSKIGYEPSKIRNNDYWYLSPLRNEKTPSFKINRKLNKWFDFGLGKGGNLIDFCILYYHCTIGELLQKYSDSFSFQQPTSQENRKYEVEEKQIKVLGDFTLSSVSLLRYLQQRRIPLEIADKFCREVRYKLDGKTYYGIGFKNDSGGYEIRNSYIKTSSAPKDITTVQNGSKIISVFEGFFDFLSFVFINQNGVTPITDYLILNSVSFFEKARPVMEKYEEINLYLDNDNTGQNCSHYAISLSAKYRDNSSLYKNHKDLNDWICQIGQPQKIP